MAKKIFFGIAALGVALAVIPLLSAFEAHVINVTAQIDNQLFLNPIPDIDFGTVFPQEKLDKFFDIVLSQTFLNDQTLDDLEYVVRQKPKCQAEDPQAPIQHPQVNEDVNGNFICPDGSTMMPLLCPYLSKKEISTDGTDNGGENDEPEILAFHGPLTSPPWNLATTLLYETGGKLIKSGGDLADEWNVDLKVPCFSEHCAQDWEKFVSDINPDANSDEFIQPAQNEHLTFGCDLWVEVTATSSPPGGGLPCDEELDLMLVLDRSGSIDSAELQTLKTASHAFIDALNPSAAGVHVGQASFSTSGTLNLHLTDDEAAAHLAINALASGGTTDLEAGITLATNEMDAADPHERPAVNDVMVVITDGNPNVPSEAQGRIDAAAAADAARVAGIEVYVVGIGSDVDAAYLQTDIADDAAHYFAAADFDDLEAILQALVACDLTRKTYTFAGVSTANDGTGGNPIAFEHDSDQFPWTATSDINNATSSPDDTEYTAISTDNNTRWESLDPGGNDFIAKRFRFFLTEPIANITDIKILWKGQPNNTANATLWLHKTGTSDFSAANWDQQGLSLNIPADTDRYIVRHLTSGFTTYIDPVTGQFDFVMTIDNDNEELRTDYVQIIVTSTP